MRIIGTLAVLGFAYCGAAAIAGESVSPSGYTYTKFERDLEYGQRIKKGVKVTITSQEQFRNFLEDYMSMSSPLDGIPAIGKQDDWGEIALEFKGPDFKDLKLLGERYSIFSFWGESSIELGKSSTDLVAGVGRTADNYPFIGKRKILEMLPIPKPSKKERIGILGDLVQTLSDHSACQKLESLGLKMDYKDKIEYVDEQGKAYEAQGGFGWKANIHNYACVDAGRVHVETPLCRTLLQKLGYEISSVFDITNGKSAISDPWIAPKTLNSAALQYIKGLKKAQEMDLVFSFNCSYGNGKPAADGCSFQSKDEHALALKKEKFEGIDWDRPEIVTRNIECLPKKMKALGYAYDSTLQEWIKPNAGQSAPTQDESKKATITK